MTDDLTRLDPKRFGLHPRTVLMQDTDGRLFLVMDRKSRIIMKDARAVLDKVMKIRNEIPGADVALRTTAPVCSKSVRFLEDNGIAVISL